MDADTTRARMSADVGIEDLPIIRRAINDPGHYVRRHYVLVDDYGEPKTKRMEPVGHWSARAVLAALGVTKEDPTKGEPIEIDSMPGMWS